MKNLALMLSLSRRWLHLDPITILYRNASRTLRSRETISGRARQVCSHQTSYLEPFSNNTQQTTYQPDSKDLCWDEVRPMPRLHRPPTTFLTILCSILSTENFSRRHRRRAHSTRRPAGILRIIPRLHRTRRCKASSVRPRVGS